LFVVLLSKKEMIDVGAVGISRSLRDFQILWARSWRPPDVSVHIVFAFAKNFNRPIHNVEDARHEKEGITSVATPSRKSLLGHPGRLFSLLDPGRLSDHAHCPSVPADRARSSNTAGLTWPRVECRRRVL
jgi:hypothetical protein